MKASSPSQGRDNCTCIHVCPHPFLRPRDGCTHRPRHDVVILCIVPRGRAHQFHRTKNISRYREEVGSCFMSGIRGRTIGRGHAFFISTASYPTFPPQIILKSHQVLFFIPTAYCPLFLPHESCCSNMYNRRVLAGEFAVVNKHLLRDLTQRGLWTAAVRNQIIADQGSVQRVDIPQDLKVCVTQEPDEASLIRISEYTI